MVYYKGIMICVPLYIAGTFLLGTTVAIALFVFHVAMVPMIFRYSKTFRRNLVFLNFVQWPLYTDFEEPSSNGIDGGRNFTIEYHSKVDNCPIRIGIWHILPKSVYERLKNKFEGNVDKDKLNKLLDDELVNSQTPIMMYCHGNSNSRATSHRLALYKFFQRMDYHTIAFDYRGYGDSTKVMPSENGVVEDALVVYEWLQSTIEKAVLKPAVFVWGHSLGTGISSHMLGKLEPLSRTLLERQTSLPPPKGLILEAPFNNLADEVKYHPLGKLVRWLPYHEASFCAPFRRAAEPAFRTDEHLEDARRLPVLLLHARDDLVVPVIVGRKLYKSLLASRSEGGATVKLHEYDKKENLGHTWICHGGDLPEVVGEFVNGHR
ncbi:lysophosphatidylserine lipase ABHD12-like [Achroia grisella]|uniref:lysophosphatidylserine lipase ABHD12-like n=1 Tax=Achroia grisella TaxID=688607 RepID=UPI0027D2046A|nr:lysophosphatidylserine lipase ABHD12-like [Achroia grisella]